MDIKEIILLRGLQGSGKSTWAKQWVSEDPKNRIRYNNDDIRTMLGNQWVPDREVIIHRVKDTILSTAMRYGYNVVIDNMNLNPKELENLKVIMANYSETHHNYTYSLIIKNFNTPLEVCIERDKNRKTSVGEKVIIDTYNKYKQYYDWL